jgi:hypothetical protein
MSEIKLAVCADPECRSQKVELTSIANWDIEKQKWIKEYTEAGSYCYGCQNRDYGIDLMTEKELEAEDANNE